MNNHREYSLIKNSDIEKIFNTYERLNFYIDRVNEASSKIENIETELFKGDKEMGKEPRFLAMEGHMSYVVKMVNKMESQIEDTNKLYRRIDELEANAGSNDLHLNQREIKFVRNIYNALSTWQTVLFVAATLAASIYGIIQLLEWIMLKL